MNTYEDYVQYQMLLDVLNLNNSLVSLSHEYYCSCFPADTFNTYVTIAGGGAPRMDHNFFAADTSNFLLGIPFAADSSHMEGLARTSTDINWSTHGAAQTNPLEGTFGATLTNTTPAVTCVFNAVCDWNLIMMSRDSPISYQCYSTQTILNS
jgi:hypothetical protein